MGKNLLTVLQGGACACPPVWLMRQAGRYLPEYRKVRAQVSNFLELCYTPKLAFEVTMQPLRRFPLDAAIVFSDILVLPHALGRDLRFVEGKGPVLAPLQKEEIGHLQEKGALERLSACFETLSLLKSALPAHVALIGFCGAPWTVATYMIAGQGTQDQMPARLFSYTHREAFLELLETLARVSAQYLIEQIRAGAEVVQIFDSWSGVLPEPLFEAFCITPVKKMVAAVKAVFPDVPIIGFPKGAGFFYETYAQKTGVDAVSLDWTVPLSVAKRLQSHTVVQGNLDPLCLVAGGKVLETATQALCTTLGPARFIANLGHGILPQTPPAHVDAFLKALGKTPFS